ncbi:MAG: IS66 family insertion sequence element accessory protein TnpA, partial [Planctomycetota bacterium]
MKSRGARVKLEQFWRDLVEKQARSALSVRRLCELEGISQPSFYLWRKRLMQEIHHSSDPAAVDPAAGSIKHVRSRTSSSTTQSVRSQSKQAELFLPVGTLSDWKSSSLEILHPASP